MASVTWIGWYLIRTNSWILGIASMSPMYTWASKRAFFWRTFKKYLWATYVKIERMIFTTFQASLDAHLVSLFSTVVPVIRSGSNFWQKYLFFFQIPNEQLILQGLRIPVKTSYFVQILKAFFCIFSCLLKVSLGYL